MSLKLESHSLLLIVMIELFEFGDVILLVLIRLPFLFLALSFLASFGLTELFAFPLDYFELEY